MTGFIVDRTGAFTGAFVVAAAAAVVSMLAWGVIIRRVETVQWLPSVAPMSLPPPIAPRISIE